MLVPRKMKQEHRQLLDIYKRLQPADRQSLLSFAEFLATRKPAGESAPAEALPVPLDTPRPPAESVVAAIKRLSASYFMLDAPELLHETSSLMTQHVMQGREAAGVIDELEALFERSYRQLADSHTDGEQ